jgi:hypothetical protein
MSSPRDIAKRLTELEAEVAPPWRVRTLFRDGDTGEVKVEPGSCPEDEAHILIEATFVEPAAALSEARVAAEALGARSALLTT